MFKLHETRQGDTGETDGCEHGRQDTRTISTWACRGAQEIRCHPRTGQGAGETPAGLPEILGGRRLVHFMRIWSLPACDEAERQAQACWGSHRCDLKWEQEGMTRNRECPEARLTRTGGGTEEGGEAGLKDQVDRGRPLPGHMGAVTISHGHTQKGHGQSREDLCPPGEQGQQAEGGSGHQATLQC